MRRHDRSKATKPKKNKKKKTMNRSLPKYENPPPPPPRTDEGKAWRDYHQRVINKKAASKEGAFERISYIVIILACLAAIAMSVKVFLCVK